jgi:hypothetical protein
MNILLTEAMLNREVVYIPSPNFRKYSFFGVQLTLPILSRRVILLFYCDDMSTVDLALILRYREKLLRKGFRVIVSKL